MSTVTTVATVAQPLVTAVLAGAVAYAAKLIGSGRFDRVVAEAVAVAPRVEEAVAEADRIPVVHALVADVEAAARAEAERLNAATHGAIDQFASILAATVPRAIQDAIVQAHAAVPAPVEVPAVVPVPAAGSGAETGAQPVEAAVPVDVAVVRQ